VPKVAFEPEQHVRIRPDDVTWRSVGDEVIVLDMRTWEYMGLNGSGATLWPALVEGATPAALGDLLMETYGIDRGTAGRDVEAFLTSLRESQLLAA
jgi:hypothetical protein